MSKTKQKQLSEDELLDQCIKLNEICSHVTCEKSIKLIQLKCDLCRQLFCTSHVLPEVHGCGDAAKKSASADFHRPQKKTPNPQKMQELEKKMSRKLDQMKNDRKKKKN